jgi:hypothetical protein
LFGNVGTQTRNCIIITQRSRYKPMECSLQCERFQVLSALMLKIEVLRHATPCRSDLTPNMKALVFSKTSGTIIQRYDVTAQKTWNFQTRSRLAQTILKTAATYNPKASVTLARLHGISLPKHVLFFCHQRGKQTNKQTNSVQRHCTYLKRCLPLRMPAQVQLTHLLSGNNTR